MAKSIARLLMFDFPFQAICPKEKDNSCKKPKNYNRNIPIETILTLRDKGLTRNELDNMVDRRRKNIKLGDILRLSKRDLSYREIGLILGCTKQSIGKRIRDWKRSKLK